MTSNDQRNILSFKLKRIIKRQLIAFFVTALVLMSKTLSFGFSHNFHKRTTRPIAFSYSKLQATNNPDDYPSQSKSQSNTNNGHIPTETIEEIKTYADIVTVIESYDLPFFSRSSDGYRAKCICPFHNDRNPSLNIDNSRGIYKCFSCGAGGDVFNFVREYDFINGNKGGKGGSGSKGEKMSFPAAIQKVAGEFCGGALAQKVQSTFSSSGGRYNRTMTPEKREKLHQQQKTKERILLANSAAADFYARGLISNPTAGIARAHLHERGITPAMVRTFALGFAPEAYFNRSGGQGNRDAWGKGSLVERLEELKFSPREILDAGLATLTSKARSRLQLSSTGSSIMYESVPKNITKAEERINGVNKSENGTKGEIEHSDLMDRFRSRLIIPIFDLSGRNVIGFGGRHLAPKSNADNDIKSSRENPQSYVAAKYLNTPETPVFSKKDILFGSHSASAAIDDMTDNRNSNQVNMDQPGLASFQANVQTLIIVEGYFDAITLYGAGIKEVVASMGTALTTSQLKMSASALGNRGRIILCLDNDEAGLNAVERLCTGSGIWDVVEETGIEIHVASLPDGIKDPAEFIEAKGGASKASSGENFRTDILDTSVSWNLWFISRLISRYNPDDSSSFSSVCESVSSFLSTHRNAAERTKQAYEAAGKLAEHITKDTGGSGDGPLKIQLESDLLGMASRKASAREALARRVEAADGEGGSKDKLARLFSGEATVPDQQETGFLERRKLGMNSNGKVGKVGPDLRSRPDQSRRNIPPRQDNSFRQKNTRNLRYNQERQAPPLTKHFNGFQFSETDAAWLGITNEKSKQNFVLGEPDQRIGEPEKRNNRRNLVYFNSNKYLGNERSILSNIAGKNSTAPVIEGIANPLMKPSANRLLLDAESRLLRTMVHYPSARLAMKSALANRMGDGNTFLEWTNLDREWLFQCLTDSPGHEQIPQELQDGGNAVQLEEHLRNRPDVPSDAFGSAFIEIGDNERENRSTFTKHNNDIVDTDALPISTGGISNHNEKWEIDTVIEGGGMRFDTQDLEEQLIKSELIVDNMPGSSENGRKMKHRGTLDDFFVEDELLNVELREGSASHEERAALTVQEAVSVMLKATAINTLNQVKDEWETMIAVQKKRTLLDINGSIDANSEALQKTTDLSVYEALSDDQLDLICTNLGQKVSEAMTTARELSESTSALNNRLLSYCAADGVEGRINLKQREDLAKALDEHLASLPEDPRPDTSGASRDYVFGSDEYDSSIDSHFGGGRPDSIMPSKPSDDESEQPIAESIYDSIFE